MRVASRHNGREAGVTHRHSYLAAIMALVDEDTRGGRLSHIESHNALSTPNDATPILEVARPGLQGHRPTT